MQIPKSDMVLTYRCGVCGKIYTHNNSGFRCAVNHPPGTCCHYGEHEVSEAIFNSVINRLSGVHDVEKYYQDEEEHASV